MQQRGTFVPVFLIFLFLISLIFLFSQTKFLVGVSGFFEGAMLPLQRFTFGIFNSSNKSSEDNLRGENLRLTTELVKQKEIEKENKALHDQFAVSNPEPKQLLPARIIGRHDDEIIVDKGERDGVRAGFVVVFKDNLLGQVSDASMYRAVIRLLVNDKSSFTAKTVKTEATGVISGKGGDKVVFDKVVLSESLEKDDVVVTKGDVDQNGRGYPPDLVVGKIISVNKKASSLFQSAEVKSLIDFSKLETVFVLVN